MKKHKGTCCSYCNKPIQKKSMMSIPLTGAATLVGCDRLWCKFWTQRFSRKAKKLKQQRKQEVEAAILKGVRRSTRKYY